MSLIDPRLSEAVSKADTKDAKDIDPEIKLEPANYEPTPLERKVRGQILNDFTLGYQTLYRPRQEFNDLSVLQRDQVDSMAFNTYQPANGELAAGDLANAWRSNAIRPIERNKAISMAGHAAGRLGFLRLQATDYDAKPDDDAAMVVNSCMDWVNSTYFPKEWWLHAVLQAEVSPACIIHHEFRQVFRKTKTTRSGEGWNYKDVLDEANSGFMATVVPTDQIYIENIFEKDIQKQRFVIWRRVQSHDQLEAKYKGRKNWDMVRKGMQLLFNDANQGFYFAYDPNLRGELGEEVCYWTKADGGSFVTMVNGIIIGEADEKNPREDGLYPFVKWFYSWVRDNFFYGKSLVFAVSHDANIINTLYPVLVDGAILDTMKPTKYIGKDEIGSDVIIPGATVTMRDPNAKLEPLLPPLQTGNLLNAMAEVEKSLDQTANTQATPANRPGGITAYEMSLRDQQVQQDLGPFYAELIGASVQMTRLVMGDVLQFMTVADVSKMQGAKAGLRYKSFLVDLKSGENKAKRRHIKFEPIGDEMADPMKALAASYDVLEEQGGMNAETEIVKADPVRIRALKYSMMMTDDVLQPKSESVRFKQNLEMLDQIIKTEQVRPGLNNMEAVVKKLLYSTNPTTARDPESFIGQQNPPQGQASAAMPPTAGQPPMAGPQPTQPQPQPAF
jgi:hypothetical protein